MCGIVGIHHLTPGSTSAMDNETRLKLLERMLGFIQHRGPDEFGIYLDRRIGLGNARLSIIDLQTGSQPISNEDGTVWIVFNGEIFNYVELRPGLEAQGHRFQTTSDTEVIVHLYEQYGPDCVQHMNGQFAFAIWDCRPQAGSGILLLARDRVGIRPLFYTVTQGTLVFGSEIKSLFLHPAVRAQIDRRALAQVFTFWTTRAPRTPFVDIYEVPPGHTLIAGRGEIQIKPYWRLNFPEPGDEPQEQRSDEEWAEGLRELLSDATRIRLRADVPVGAYLSGGLDSSAIATLIHNHRTSPLETFSITFTDPAFDERVHQEEMVAFLGTDHHCIECADVDIGSVFPDVVWHAEWPLLRTSPAPMYLLSGLARQHGFKVVLTGEGADEFLGGYNIFKEDKVRRFWARDPDSASRPLLLQRLYPYVSGLGQNDAFVRAFFGRRLIETARLEYSHLVRWENTAPLRRFLALDLEKELSGYDPVAELVAELETQAAFKKWTPLARAQYLETSIFMSEYLLSSQGDRMLSAHSVEGRFPFLDYRVIEFASRIPPRLKIRGLNEKYILKRAMGDLLPASVLARTKQPYRAPIQRSFLGPAAPSYVQAVLSEKILSATGLFRPSAVVRLVEKAAGPQPLSERDNMALVGILSTQLLYEQFCERLAERARAIPSIQPLRLCMGAL